MRTQPRITHDLLHRGVSRCLVRPLDPREHHHFVILCLHSTAKVGQLAIFDVIAPALEDALRAVLDEYRIALLGVIDELLLVRLGHCNHEAVAVTHLPAPRDKRVVGTFACDGVILVKVPRAAVESGAERALSAADARADDKLKVASSLD